MLSMADDRKDKEQQLVAAQAERLDVESYAAWSRLTTPHRISVHANAILILWTLGADKQPKIEDKFTVVDIGISWSHGVRLTLKQQDNKRFVSVDHRPQQLFNLHTVHDIEPFDVFVWCPFFPDVRYTPHPGGVGFALRTSLCMRLKSHPDYAQPGDTFLMPVGEFRGRFPQFADTRF